jgi:ubiquinone/menaquinone biosynthesis C-methylase UbiE
MPAPEFDIQQEWTPDHLARSWRDRFHTAFMLECGAAAVTEAVLDEASGRVLEVGAADASHSTRFAARGLVAVVVEPSTAMLGRAGQRAAEHGAPLRLVRGIGEHLPFADGAFDRVLCDSALDHFASPDQGVREMARVLARDGRLVISFVNYAGLAARVSRGWDGLARTMRPSARAEPRPWDSPVGFDHTF